MISNLDSTALTLDINKKKLQILDQRALPFEEKWIEVIDADHYVELVKTLAIRGAPLIGISAAIQCALSSYQLKTKEEIQSMALRIKNARPTAVNLSWAITYMLEKNPSYLPDVFLKIALELFSSDVKMCERIALNAQHFIQDGDKIFTICNSGGLATAGIGTALGAIIYAHKLGKKIHVFVPETRPLLQGARLTAWELIKNKIPFTLVCDSMIAYTMQKEKISSCIVGADRIARNGDFANKVGTYSMAVSSSYHKIPFYVAAPISTFDRNTPTGQEIPVELRDKKEILPNSDKLWINENFEVFNPSFDITNFSLVKNYILDSGNFSSENIHDCV